MQSEVEGQLGRDCTYKAVQRVKGMPACVTSQKKTKKKTYAQLHLLQNQLEGIGVVDE